MIEKTVEKTLVEVNQINYEEDKISLLFTRLAVLHQVISKALTEMESLRLETYKFIQRKLEEGRGL